MRRKGIIVPLLLFVLTVLTTMTAGALYEGAPILEDPWKILVGLPFSASLLFILGTHELGHYFAARYHRVDVTPPFFIPAPPIPPMIGTFGAVIKMRSPIATKRALVDIGAAGPLTGFVAALVITIVGLTMSKVMPAPEEPALGLGSSLIFELLGRIVVGELPDGYELYLHPVAFAGWIGFFVTSLNLLPIGQLDGGHLIYALFGKTHFAISRLMTVVLVALGLLTWRGWILWAVLVTIIGVWHPPVVDPYAPLDRRRLFISILTIVVFVLTFTPYPFYIL